MRREEIVTAARTYLGVRFVHEGRSRGGLDCAGLLCRVFTDLGLPYEDKLGYDRSPVGQDFFKQLLKHMTPNLTNTLPIGSVGLIRQSRYPCHIGIFSEIHGRKHFIQANELRREVVEEAWMPHPKFGLIMVLDIPGVTE